MKIESVTIVSTLCEQEQRGVVQAVAPLLAWSIRYRELEQRFEDQSRELRLERRFNLCLLVVLAVALAGLYLRWVR